MFFATVIYVFFLLCSIPEYLWWPVLPLFFPAASGQGQIHVLSDMKMEKKSLTCVLGNQPSLQLHLWLS